MFLCGKPGNVKGPPVELLERETASFHESLKGLDSKKVLELYRKKIEELEMKLREERLEYESARAREEFFDQAASEVYLGKFDLSWQSTTSASNKAA